MEKTIAEGTVERLGGATRYETNLQILKEAGVGSKDILVCTGTGFADSLSASAAQKPILLVGEELTEGQKEFLADTSCRFVIIGGESAVSAELEAELGEMGTTERLGGATRYETSILVAEKYFSNPRYVVLAYALNFPDGLCGGPLAVSLGAPLILTIDGNDNAAEEYVDDYGVASGVVLGGTSLISDDTVRTILNMSADTEIIVK